SRQRRIDRIAPPEGAELRTRQLHDAVLRRAGVERARRLLPRRWWVLVALEGRIDEPSVEQRRQVEDRQPNDDARHEETQARPSPNEQRRCRRGKRAGTQRKTEVA